MNNPKETQVVADERAAFEAWWKNGAACIGPERTAWDGFKAGPVADPVQAQEPVEIAGLGRITDKDDGYLTLQFKDEESAQKFMGDYGPSVDVRDMPPIAPVQPVAVPDGWKLVPIKPTADMICAGAMVDPERQSPWEAYLAACPIAPAAQGDAKELTDAQLMEIAETHFYQIEAETMDARILSFYRAAIAAKAAS